MEVELLVLELLSCGINTKINFAGTLHIKIKPYENYYPQLLLTWQVPLDNISSSF